MLQNPDTLLIYNKWNEHVLFDHLTIENCENFFATAKLVNTFTTDSSKQTVNACNICSSALTLFKVSMKYCNGNVCVFVDYEKLWHFCFFFIGKLHKRGRHFFDVDTDFAKTVTMDI